ncbi:MAG TPA: ABC transporter permease subunit [Methylomirabilota bacterium]|jgi:ABC-type nitrate/sulfonate/bicarbonate transport system permease component
MLVRLAVLMGLLALWELWAARRDPLLYVPPSRVLPALGRVIRLEAYPALLGHLGLTVLEVLAAYALAVGLGLALGFALGLPRHVGEIYEPLLAALYAIPNVVWYPSLMLFFGLGPASKIAFGVLLGFFPVVLAVLAGIRSVDPHLLTVARGLGAGTSTCFLKVVLPAIAATLVAGFRTGLALTVVGVLVGEILGARAGLGYLINYAYGRFRTADYAALALLALLLVVVIDGAAAWVESRARRWIEGAA